MEPFDLRHWPEFVTAGGNSALPAVVDQVVIDSRRISSSNALFVALPGTFRDGHHFISSAASHGARYAIVNRAWNPPCQLEGIQLIPVENPLTALQQIARLYRNQRSAHVVGITGSLGKTMLKDLLYHLLSSYYKVVASPESFNSQIGVALSLLEITDQDKFAIIEAGISKPGEMNILANMVTPDHVIITNIAKQHAATLGDQKTIAKEKLSFAASLPSQGWLLAPSQIQELQPLLSPRTHFWDLPKSDVPHTRIEKNTDTISYALTFPDHTQHYGQLVHGIHYHVDLVAIATQAAWLLGVPADFIVRSLQDYHIETTRTEVWHSSQGVTLINSSYGADPQSVDIALRRLADAPPGSRKIFVFGGLRSTKPEKQTDLKRIAQAIQSNHVDRVVLYGPRDLSPIAAELSTLFDFPGRISIRRKAPDAATDDEGIALAISEKADAADGRLAADRKLHEKSNKAELSIPVETYPSLHTALQSVASTTISSDYVLLKGPSKPPLTDVATSFGDDLPPNICTINLAAVAQNLESIRERLKPNTRVMAVVKALAYGTEDTRMAKFLQSCGVDILGVSFIDEGVNLKRAGVTQAVFALNAVPSEARKAVQWDIEVGVSDLPLIDALGSEACRQNKTIKVHLHINTGMARLGCRPEDTLALAERIRSTPGLCLEGVMTHLACAESPEDDAFTQQQYSRFLELVAMLEKQGFTIPWRHVANSAAIIRHPMNQCNMVRVGLAIYGLHASSATRDALDLKLAISLTSRIVGINHCLEGETVGYGRSYRTQKKSEKIAVLPLGYFDGLHRQYSGKAFVLIKGEPAPMIGNICMDYMMVNVTELPSAAVGDEVLIFGNDAHGYHLSPEELATSVGSIAHQLVTCLGPRIKRLFIYE